MNGYTLKALSELLSSRRISSAELTREYLSRAETDEVGAFLTVTSEKAISKAADIDSSRIAGHKAHRLAGIPFALKDNIITRGVRTTCASRMLENFVPVYESTASERLADCGGVLIGKTNMDEFAMGSSTANSHFKKTLNPRDHARVPGGSSGGSAAAVAADEAPYALGSDTGGSVRQPAAFCGCVGLKPTYGRVSRYGLVAFASSLDQIGVLAENVYDSAIVLSAISGRDEHDATSVGKPENFTDSIESGVDGLRIGIPEEFFSADGIDARVAATVMSAAERYEKLGAKLVRVSFASLKYALPAYYVISSAEASSNLARFDGVRYGHRAEDFNDIDELFERSRSEGFGDEVKRRIMLGTFVLSAGYYDRYYKRALGARQRVAADFASAFSECDLILTPTTPTVAWRFGERPDPMSERLGDIFTVPASLAGLPAISVPCGEVDGMPVGMQLIGREFDEKTILRAGHAFEVER